MRIGIRMNQRKKKLGISRLWMGWGGRMFAGKVQFKTK